MLLPEGVPAQDLELRVHQLPGVSARVGEDGSFTLHHLAMEDATLRADEDALGASYAELGELKRAGHSEYRDL